MNLKDSDAVCLIAEVYNKAYSETETFEHIGTSLAYLLGGLANLAQPGDHDPVVFDPCSEQDLAFVAMLEGWFPYDHRIWRHVNRTIG